MDNSTSTTIFKGELSGVSKSWQFELTKFKKLSLLKRLLLK